MQAVKSLPSRGSLPCAIGMQPRQRARGEEKGWRHRRVRRTEGGEVGLIEEEEGGARPGSASLAPPQEGGTRGGGVHGGAVEWGRGQVGRRRSRVGEGVSGVVALWGGMVGGR